MASTLQVGGAVAITVGTSLVFLPAGIIVGGAFLLVIGYAMGMNK